MGKKYSIATGDVMQADQAGLEINSIPAALSAGEKDACLVEWRECIV